MANIRNANTFYVDTVAADTSVSTTGNLVVQNAKVKGVVVTASSANAVIVLKDISTGNIKLDLRVPTSGETKFFEFRNSAVLFPNGISPSTVTNGVATIILDESRG